MPDHGRGFCSHIRIGEYRLIDAKHSQEDADSYRRIAAGDKAERNRMAERHLGLVHSVASSYKKKNHHLSMDDLMQEGFYGVVYALDRFDVDKGYRFSTYATYWIRHFIQRFVVSNHSRGLSSKRKDVEAYLGMRMDGDDRELYEQRCSNTISLSWSTDGGALLTEVVEDTSVGPVEDNTVDSLDIRNMIYTLFDHLDSREQRTVLSMRYGVMGHNPHTITQVAQRMGIRNKEVMKIEQCAIDALHDFVGKL